MYRTSLEDAQEKVNREYLVEERTGARRELLPMFFSIGEMFSPTCMHYVFKKIII